MERQAMGKQIRVILIGLALLALPLHIFLSDSYGQFAGDHLRNEARQYRQKAEQLRKEAAQLRQRRINLERTVRIIKNKEAARSKKQRRQQNNSSSQGGVAKREPPLMVPSWMPLQEEASQLQADEEAKNKQAEALYQKYYQLNNEAQTIEQDYERQRQMAQERFYQETLERDRQEELARQRRAEAFQNDIRNITRELGATCFVTTAENDINMAEKMFIP